MFTCTFDYVTLLAYFPMHLDITSEDPSQLEKVPEKVYSVVMSCKIGVV